MLEIPAGLDAVTDAMVVPETVVPFRGLVIEIEGEEFSTVTVNDAVAVFPAASWTVHITTVVPIGNVEPEAGMQYGTTNIAPSLSLADTLYVTTAPTALVACNAIEDGTEIDGGVLSKLTVIEVEA